MLASLLIIAVSLMLFAYWLRYSCLLLLRATPVTEHAGAVARANRLAFPDVRSALSGAPEGAALEGLYRSLDKDYRILYYLVEHSTGLELPVMEQKLLAGDYQLMQAWYGLVKRLSASHARKALLEMSDVVSYFSQKMGEHVAQTSAVA